MATERGEQRGAGALPRAPAAITGFGGDNAQHHFLATDGVMTSPVSTRGVRAGAGLLALACVLFGFSLLNGCATRQGAPPPPPPPPLAAASDQPLDTMALFAAGESRAWAGDSKGAEELFQKAIKQDPTSGFLRLELARLYLGQGQLDEALAEAEEATRLSPELINAWVLVGG
ncbi:MAG: tetratricopeptide repeat protein, partial [Desulfarculus sp.]|nr:tetratricopeptide repeat protein [Desulfarculus sp.]